MDQELLTDSPRLPSGVVEIRPLHAGVPRPLPAVSGRPQQFLAAAVVSMLAFMFGLSVGWPSPVQPLLQSSDSPVGPLSEDQVSWMASLSFLGGICGSFFWSRIADAYGRKAAGYAISVPFAVGWGLTAFTADSLLLLAARFIVGVGGSGALILSPTYIGEIAQDSIRGTLGSFVVLAMNAGILTAYFCGAALPYDPFNYLCFAVTVAFVAVFALMPESPVYLWTTGNRDAAESSLIWLRGGDLKSVQQEKLNLTMMKKREEVGYLDLVNTKGKRLAMLIGLGLFTWQQFCGILAILSYTSHIFHKSGSSISPEKATIIVGIFQLFASFVSSVIVDRSGRKVLLLVSYLAMGISLTVLGVYFYLENCGHGVGPFAWIPVASLSLHVITYSVGGGPVPYVVMSETLPSEVRGLAASIIILWGTLLAFVSVKIFPLLVALTGFHGCFWFFSIFCYTGFIFTLFVVPETKGVPLPDILKRLNGEML